MSKAASHIELTIIAKVADQRMVEKSLLPGETLEHFGIDLDPSAPVVVEFFFNEPRDRMRVEWMTESKEIRAADCDRKVVLDSIFDNPNAHLAILAFIQEQSEASRSVH